ncbi:FAD/NAD(P)-binding domain-containing protein [Pholiota conissans]|uniref:FAD/NAD(P)-binding domain-containing protein n=1 Tax=Pholiota conissans TaxID=109636 RepID=A0A9P6CZW3_9AGAR|nr:FAD/NAD(P)-binding domain-containing protein [Pholiota conissans]
MPTSLYVVPALQKLTNNNFSQSAELLRAGNFFDALNPIRFAQYVWCISYILTQAFIILLFKPPPPKSPNELENPRGRIAVVGAGVTGVSSAAHAIAHGFEVVIFEQGSESSLGGIWAHVNSTSGLQLNSLLYRFHPAVMWTKVFPLRDEIVGEITKIWKEYHLESRTRFNTKVTSVRRVTDKSRWEQDVNRSRWIINDNEDEIFDAIIVNVGTCGEPNWIKLPGMPEDVGKKSKTKKTESPKHESPSQDDAAEWPPLLPANKDNTSGETDDTFTKIIVHSSELDSPSFQLRGGDRVVVIGSGASGVEAVETVLDKFGSVHDSEKIKKNKPGVAVSMIARNDKWIIPRNIIIDTTIAGQPFGREMPLSFLWEKFLRYWQYSGIPELVPQNLGIYESTPVVNDVFLDHVRSGRCRYIRGQPTRLTKDGVIVEARKSKSKSKSKSWNDNSGKAPKTTNTAVEEIEAGEEKLIEADVVVLATGYKKPTIDFLPEELFPEGYQRPDLYLQNFSTEDWSVLTTNSAYMNAIGTVNSLLCALSGHFHIGIYTRILLTLLLDEGARPSSKDMKLWVDVLRFIKRGATGGALGFFTYMELTIWLILFHILRPDRIRWLFFIMNGWGVYSQK